MKVLFAVSSEKVSETIVKRYQKEYKEIISYKNVYYFNAILKEIQKDKSYDRIVISEDLEPFSNNNYDTIDKFIFEKLDDISDEAQDINGNETSIILICTDRRTKGSSFLVKLFGLGIYNALLGGERSMEQVCKLIKKPRGKKEAKIYYKIDTDDVNYSSSSSDEVSELEIQNILTHFRKIGKNQDKYVESFNNIASQYTDTQLQIIVNCLPNNVKAVLEDECKKYQELVATTGKITKASRESAKARKENGIKIDIIENQANKPQMNGPIVIPSLVKKKKTVATEERKPLRNGNSQIEQPRNRKVIKRSKDMSDEAIRPEIKPKRKIEMESKPTLANKKVKKTNGNKVKREENRNLVVDNGVKRKEKVKPINSDRVKPVNSDKIRKDAKNKNVNINNTRKDESVNVGRPLKKKPISFEEEVLPKSEEVQPKRGRGRPRKPIDETKIKPKGKRGRPRKNPIEEFEEDFDDIMLPGMDGEFEEFDDNALENMDIEMNDEPYNDFDEIEYEENNGYDESDEEEYEEDSSYDESDEEEYEEDDSYDELDEEEYEENDSYGESGEEEYEEDDSYDESDEEEYEEDDSYDELDEEEYEEGDSYGESGEDDFEEDNVFEEDEFTEEVSLPDLDDLDDLDNDDDINEILPRMDEEEEDEELELLSNFDDEDDEEPLSKESNNQLESIKSKIDYSMSSLNSLLTKDKKIVTFIGTSKNGTSFLINNLAALFSSLGINTAILDMTKNRNSYYMYTNNDERLRKIAYNSISKLQKGFAEGIKSDKNLTVYTALPNDGKDYSDAESILSTLVQNHSLILIDCDFDTNPAYFASCQEIYLVQSMDILTIQPLTAFLRDLKSQGVLESEKVRVVVNKEIKVRSLTSKVIIRAMSVYNDPSMSFMTELFNKDMVKACSIPFEDNVYSKYLDSIANCKVSINGYSKNFTNKLRTLGDMVYPLVGKSTSYGKSSPQTNYGSSSFSNNMNNTLNQMKKKKY